MSSRATHRIAVVVTLLLVLGTEAQAQRPTRRVRQKPFAALSLSAQRLKDSVAVRLGGDVGSSSAADSANAEPVWVLPTASAHDSVIAAARSQIGARYLLGAERPGKAFDCSGLVRFVMSVLRIDLPRTAREQAMRGAQVAKDVTQLRPGDLLTFGRGARVSHIGVYIGEGRFIHASTSRRQVVEASIDQPGTWFRRNWVGVRRLLASAEEGDTVGTR